MNQNTSYLVPHEADFQTLKQWRNWSDIVFWALFICSIVSPFISFSQVEGLELITKLFDWLNFILIPVFFILEIVCDRYYISAEYTRRSGFIDNSFGAKLTGVTISGYHTNDDLEPNFYKAAVNTFENCFFTERISREMFTAIGFKNFAFFILFLGFAYFGAAKNTFVMPILQCMLSGYFLKEFIDFCFFRIRVQTILEGFKSFFNGLIHRDFMAADVPVALKHLMDYETNLAHGRFKSDSKVFQKLNDELSVEWTKTKEYYNIKS